MQAHAGDEAPLWQGPYPLAITFDVYKEVLAILGHLAPIINLPRMNEHVSWNLIQRQYFTPDFETRVNYTIESLLGLIEEVNKGGDLCPSPASISQIRHYLGLAGPIATVQPVNHGINRDVDMEKLCARLEEVRVALNNYLQLSKSCEKSFLIPVGWQKRRAANTERAINSVTSLTSLRRSADLLTSLANNLQVIEARTYGRQMQRVIWESSISDLLKAGPLFSIDIKVLDLKRWDSLPVLQSAMQQLKVIEAILSKLRQVRQVLEQWAIAPDSLDPATAFEIAQRFVGKYRNFLRYLHPRYKRDCRIIREWCNAGEPAKHLEFREIITAIDEYHRLSRRVNQQMNAFSQEYLRAGSALDATRTQRLFNVVKQVADWLTAQGMQELPAGYAAAIAENAGSSMLNDLLSVMECVERDWVASKNVWVHPEVERPHSMTSLAALLPDLQRAASEVLALRESVAAFVPITQHPMTVAELLEDAQQIDRLATSLADIERTRSEDILAADQLTPRLLHSFNEFADAVRNVHRLREMVSQLPPTVPIPTTAREAYALLDEVREHLPAWKSFLDRYEGQVKEFGRLLENPTVADHFETLRLDQLSAQLVSMAKDRKGLNGWIQYRRFAAQLNERGHGWVLHSADICEAASPPKAFALSLWGAWLDAYYAGSPTLQNFNMQEHRRLIEEFRKLEDEALRANALRVLEAASPAIQKAAWSGDRQNTELLHQSQLQRQHKPIRKLVPICGDQLKRYKPCWLMNPLTLSSYIPYGTLEFDVVIFDEASQMRVEHALGAIARAKQVVILGDEHQLPPTSFFAVTSDSEDNEEEADVDYESVLKAAKTILPGADEFLAYHYRSKYEDLVAFSNHHIYENRLITFPSPGHQNRAVVFEYVPDGVYEAGTTRRNVIEARRVIQLCVEQLDKEPTKSVGIIAFSKAQEQAIRDAKLHYLKSNPEKTHLESLLDEESDQPETFFIKNLETVQGDERDVIFMSVGYGPDPHRNIYNRFGPINTQFGYRRLNVAITRAREKVVCVASMRATDMNPPAHSRGAGLLQKYLEYAEKGVAALSASTLVQHQAGVEPDSPFELEVEQALTRLNYVVHRQVGVSGFKIDLAILNPVNGQDYVLGIECDGASYHSSYSARVNDRIRQEILERLGWKIYRIWSQHWLTHRQEILEDITRLVSVAI